MPFFPTQHPLIRPSVNHITLDVIQEYCERYDYPDSCVEFFLLCSAIEEGNFDDAKALIEIIPIHILNTPIYYIANGNILHLAAVWTIHDEGIIDLLISFGANPKHHDDNGDTYLTLLSSDTIMYIRTVTGESFGICPRSFSTYYHPLGGMPPIAPIPESSYTDLFIRRAYH